MAIVPEKYMRAVVCIGIPKGFSIQWVGTGFIVGKPVSDSAAIPYLVTNGHVLDGAETLILRFNNEATHKIQDVPLALYDDDHKPLFTFHDGYSLPEEKQIDIAVEQLNGDFFIENHLEIDFFNLDENVLPLKKMRESGVLEGSMIYSLGFPLGSVNNQNKTPICRMGCIARATEAQVSESNSILLDLQNFGGSSGSPIINRPELVALDGTISNPTSCLIGIVHRFIHFFGDNENVGLALANPADYIIETVEKDYTLKYIAQQKNN